MNEIESTEIEGMDGYADVQIVDDGWTWDDAGLPIFHAGSLDLIDNELVSLRSEAGDTSLKLAAVLTEAQERSFYGDATLKKVCKANNINYPTGRRIVAGYKRLQRLGEEDRTEVVAMWKSGEIFPTKPQIGAPVEDNEAFMDLMRRSADGSLPNAKLRKEVKSLTGEHVDEELPGEDEDIDVDASEDYDVDVPQEADHATQMVRFITGVTEIASQLEAAGGVKDMPLEHVPADELASLVKLMRRWSDQHKRMVSERS